MPATPIIDPATGESLVGTSPQLLQEVDFFWRERLNLFTGRALSVSALDAEQAYRGGLLATLGQAVSAGTVSGLALTMDTSGADPALAVSPGYGITANGEDVVLNSALKTHLSTVAVIDASGNPLYSFHQSVGNPTNTTYAGILLLQPVIAQVSGQSMDTGTGPIEVSGNPGASCNQDPSEYAFEDWQIADAVRLVYLPWPAGVPALPLPALAPESTLRNRLAYAIFEAEALLGPDDQLPWAMLGSPVALIAFDPGVAWAAGISFTAGQFITDPNSNLQTVQTAGASAATIPTNWSRTYGGTTTDGSVTWVNSGFAWKPLFVDCSAVVRAGGLPRRRYVLPAQPPPSIMQWQANFAFPAGNFVVDGNGNIQSAMNSGISGAQLPVWNAGLGQSTSDGTITWINKGLSGVWQPRTAFVAGQFVYDEAGNMQYVQTAGTSGMAEPAWNGIYLPTIDGSIVWVNNGTGNPPVVQPPLAQARINQLSEQLSQVMTQAAIQAAIQPAAPGSQSVPIVLADVFPTMPPCGILPAAAMDFANQTAPWLPANWSVSAAPVRLEELETALETGMLFDPIPAADDDTLGLEPVEVLVPLPDTVYDPDILVTETVAPEFYQEVDEATDARNLTLQQIETVQQELNALFAATGPNVPSNPNLVDPDDGLAADELSSRNNSAPYTPASSETFGTVLQSTWLPLAPYAASTPNTIAQFVIDSNGTIQVATVAGTSGSAAPVWNTNTAGNTVDGSVTWINNGPLAWQPDTTYAAGQIVAVFEPYTHLGGLGVGTLVDLGPVRTGPGQVNSVTQWFLTMQQVITGGVSASSPPSEWSPLFQVNTPDGIVWSASGNALWQSDFLYVAGQSIVDSAGNIQTVQTGGISGDFPPTSWNPNPGQTTQDSGVTWTNLGNSTWQPSTLYSAGQAVFDSNQDIQVVQVGGTSGVEPPTWNELSGGTAPVTTQDTSVVWTNNGPMIWQSMPYLAGRIIIDSNGNFQYATVLDANGDPQPPGTEGQPGTVPPVWNTTPGGTTTDGGITWVYPAFYSTDIQQLEAVASQPPYTVTFTNPTDTATPPTSYTVSLLTASDLDSLNSNGLQALISSLNARISSANDLLDTAFLTAQTDIYRYRQNVLGATAATALATSPVLANIATGETATATATNLQDYVASLLPTSSTTTGTSTGTPSPASNPPVVYYPIRYPVLGGAPVLQDFAQSKSLRSRAVMTNLAALKSTGADVNLGNVGIGKVGIGNVGIGNVGIGTINRGYTPVKVSPVNVIGLQEAASGVLNSEFAQKFSGDIAATQFLGGPAEIVMPGQNITATPSDITSQSPLAGAQLNLRTLTIAQRLQQSPSQEAMFYSIGNRLSFLQALQTLETDLNFVADDLQLWMDGAAPAPPDPPPTTPQPPIAVPIVLHTFSEWLGPLSKAVSASANVTVPNNQETIVTAIQTPYLVSDAAEATLFSVGVRVVEQHTMLLRALEGRVQQYVDFVNLCNTALSNIQNDTQQAQTYLGQLQNNLAQDRQNFAFTTALLSDETNRVAGVNTQRQQVLKSSVQLVAYTRARTLEAIDTAPSRQLNPANIASPVPACLQQSVSIPPELREIVGQLREAPVNWMPAVAAQMNNLQRPVLLQQLALSMQARAAQQLQMALLPSSAAGESGVYASTIATVYSANQQVFRAYQVQRAAFQPATLTSFSWSTQVAGLQSLAAVNDLISADSVHTEISNAVARAIQQISSVATCLYTRVSIALPIDRLAWALYLSGAGASVQLQSLAVLPSWNQLAYTDRQQMQMLVDWLFQQIDTTNSAATGFMSDVVRTAILLASDVPVDGITSGNVIVRTQPIVGGVVSLNLPSDRIASGMYVNLYSGASLAARAVVSDLDSSTVRATVTDVFTPGTYLETSDVAHFTAQIPQALALRPLFAGL